MTFSIVNYFFSILFQQILKCGITPHCLYRDSLTLSAASDVNVTTLSRTNWNDTALIEEVYKSNICRHYRNYGEVV